jgi:hypothetical protein
MGFDGFRGKGKPRRDLTISETQAGERGNILLTWGERLLLGPERVNGSVLREASSQKVRDQFVFRVALVRGKRGDAYL